MRWPLPGLGRHQPGPARRPLLDERGGRRCRSGPVVVGGTEQRHRRCERVRLLVVGGRSRTRDGSRREDRRGPGGPGAEPGQDRLQARAPLRLGVERGDHDAVQGPVQPGEVVLAAAYAIHDRHRRPPAERRATGGGEGDGRRPGVHVGGRRGVLAVQDLRGQVAGGAEQPAGVGQPGIVGDARQAEVDEDRRAALHQDVGGLDVAVQDADPVHRGEALGEAGGEPQQVVVRDHALVRDVVVQREPRDVAGRDVRHRRPGVRIDDLGHPPAPDPRQRAHLAGQPTARLVVAHDVLAQHLERDPVATGTAREVDDAHPALADLGQQRVVAHAGGLLRLARLVRHAARLPAPRPDPVDPGSPNKPKEG